MYWIQFAGAVGLGAILTKLLDILWLTRVTEENERKRWLRDQRLAAYAEIARDFLSLRLGGDRRHENPFEAYAIASRAILLAHDDAVADQIDRFIVDLDRFYELEKGPAAQDQAKAEALYGELSDRARQITTQLRTALVSK